MATLRDPFSTALEPEFLTAVGGRIVAGPLEALAKRRFIYVTGKGGVGKTTLSAACAMALAAQGKRVLVAMCNTKERLSAVLGTPPIGDDVTLCMPNLWAVNIEPEKALYEYGLMVLKVKTIANTLFRNDYVRSFLRAVPGMHEWAMLGKAWFHTTELLPDGRDRFDVVIFDAPATGHGLDMLRVPSVILDVAPPGVLRRDAARAVELFQDPLRSGIVVVTLPEELPVTETLELTQSVERELKMPLLKIFVNGLFEPLTTSSERSDAEAHPELLSLHAAKRAASEAEGQAVVAFARRAERERVQRASLARLLAEQSTDAVFFPFLWGLASTKEGTERLCRVVSAAEVAGR